MVLRFMHIEGPVHSTIDIPLCSVCCAVLRSKRITYNVQSAIDIQMLHHLLHIICLSFISFNELIQVFVQPRPIGFVSIQAIISVSTFTIDVTLFYPLMVIFNIFRFSFYSS